MQKKDSIFRTDMADERVDEYKKYNNLSNIEGIAITTKDINIAKITTVEILNENGSKAVGKEIGIYITIDIGDITALSNEQKDDIAKEIMRQLQSLLEITVNSVMIVGLGNEYVTPDALGPKVISNINVTRHIIKYAKEIVEPGTREISAVSPGVLGMTGIETEEIIESIVQKVKPDLIIVIDSLASVSITRVGKTIQIGNTGITPRSGHWK